MNGTFSEGTQLYKSKRYQEALQLFLSLPSGAVPGIELAYYIGLCYARLERPDDALLYLEQVVTAGADLRRIQQCRLVLAVLYTQTGRVRLADFELRKLLESGFQTVTVLSALAFAAWEQQKIEDAAELYEKALLIDGENSTALNGLGYVLACSGRDLTRALGLCKKALDVDPDSAAYLDSMGWVYYKLGLSKDAKKFLKRAREKNPKNKVVNTHYKTVHEQLSENREEERLVSIGGSR